MPTMSRAEHPKPVVKVVHDPVYEPHWRVAVLVNGRYETAATFASEAEAHQEARAYRRRMGV